MAPKIIKDVVIIAHFCDEMGHHGNNRFNYLADLLCRSGFQVELITSSFSHIRKCQKNVGADVSLGYKVTYIDEPDYKKNVSVRRLFAHRAMANRLKIYLQRRAKPDVIYCAVPSLDAGKVAADYRNKTSDVRLVIDVQDLWPEVFYMISRLGWINHHLFSPLTRIADYIYVSADVVVAVSKKYLQRALRVSGDKRRGETIYIGTELAKFDSFIQDSERGNDKTVHFVYLGTLGHSYDLKTVISAFAMAQKRSLQPLMFSVLGDGPLMSSFQAYARQLKVTVNFMGRLPYPDMVKYLIKCDVALNPIRSGAPQSIINKHADYAAAGLPVINTQECEEYRGLLDEFEAGFNCHNADAMDVCEKMLILAENEPLRHKLGRNSRRMAEVCFDRSQTYIKLVDLIGGRSDD